MVSLTKPAPGREPNPRRGRSGFLTVWSASGRHTGKYLGFHVDGLGAWIVLQESRGAAPLYLAFRENMRLIWHSFGGKRHAEMEVRP
jgi:hypothetical protein